MTAKAALAIATLSLTLLLGGCGLLGPGKSAAPAPATAAMPLTPDNVGMVRLAVANAKAKAQKAETRDEYLRLARNVYVASWAGRYDAAATTEIALAQAKAGNQPARDYLVIMVYDIQLQTAMEGSSLSAEDWRAVYVGSGIMTDAVYRAYVDMARGGKVLP
jgi:hypothetical protein